MNPPIAFLCYASGLLLVTVALRVLYSIHADRVHTAIYTELIPIAKQLAALAADKWFPDDVQDDLDERTCPACLTLDGHAMGCPKGMPPDPPVQ